MFEDELCYGFHGACLCSRCTEEIDYQQEQEYQQQLDECEGYDYD